MAGRRCLVSEGITVSFSSLWVSPSLAAEVSPPLVTSDIPVWRLEGLNTAHVKITVKNTHQSGLKFPNTGKSVHVCKHSYIYTYKKIR